MRYSGTMFSLAVLVASVNAEASNVNRTLNKPEAAEVLREMNIRSNPTPLSLACADTRCLILGSTQFNDRDPKPPYHESQFFVGSGFYVWNDNATTCFVILLEDTNASGFHQDLLSGRYSERFYGVAENLWKVALGNAEGSGSLNANHRVLRVLRSLPDPEIVGVFWQYDFNTGESGLASKVENASARADIERMKESEIIALLKP